MSQHRTLFSYLSCRIAGHLDVFGIRGRACLVLAPSLVAPSIVARSIVATSLLITSLLAIQPALAQKLNPLIVENDLRAAAALSTAPVAPAPLRLPESGKAPADAENISFVFEKLTLEGARAIPAADLRRLWQVAPGESANVAAVFAYADAITAVYRNAGYALSFAVVPAQEIDSGSFSIRIVEGRLEGLSIQGTRVSDLVRGRILDGFSVVDPSQPTKIAELERFLLLVNDLPGITARGTISPGETQQTSLLTLDVTQTRFDGGISYNNFLSDNLGRDVTVIDLKAFNQWTGRDSLHISLKSAPDIAVYRSSSMDYDTYIGSDGLRLQFAASESITEPKKGNLASLDFNSISHSNSIGLRMPWKRSRNSNIFVGSMLTSSHTVSKNGTVVTSEDKLRTLSFYAEYDVSHALGATSNLRLQMNNGLTILGARGDSRANAKPNFSTYEISGSHRHPLLRTEGGNLVGSLGVRSQFINSDDPLLANAECSFGGRQYGVGFDAGALSGEDCLLGSARLTWQRNVRNGGNTFIGQAQYFLRYDTGRLRQKGALAAGEKRSVSASSIGLGLQLVFRNGLAFLLESSQQLRRSDGTKKRNKNRTHASVHFGF